MFIPIFFSISTLFVSSLVYRSSIFASLIPSDSVPFAALLTMLLISFISPSNLFFLSFNRSFWLRVSYNCFSIKTISDLFCLMISYFSANVLVDALWVDYNYSCWLIKDLYDCLRTLYYFYKIVYWLSRLNIWLEDVWMLDLKEDSEVRSYYLNLIAYDLSSEINSFKELT